MNKCTGLAPRIPAHTPLLSCLLCLLHRPTQVLNITGAVSVAPGRQFAAAVLSDGTVRSWGSNEQNNLGDPALSTSFKRNRPGPVPGITDAVSIVAGNDHACVLHRCAACVF